MRSKATPFAAIDTWHIEDERLAEHWRGVTKPGAAR